MKTALISGIFFSILTYFGSFFSFEKQVDYSKDVKPILNKNCIACHGGVKKQGGFSVLFEEEAFAKTKSGKIAIIKGNAEASDFIKRLTHSDPEERMPQDAPPLSKDDIETLTKWVNQGAKWGEHWAYNIPKMPSIPTVGTFWSRLGLTKHEETDWIKNDIDNFVLSNLKEENLKPAIVADKNTLIRRLYLDIIGMPPTEKESVNFLNNKAENAYEQEVDKLLSRKQYGEKWTGMWLDLARYADTKGYERDVERNIWRYRDYVINSFNDDKPYDQFTIEQLAGDLLENPTNQQLIATSFHRNTMNNDEGGTVDEEFRVAAVLDRVSTTFEVWQGTSMACVQCHSHPYDPIKHDEFYKTMAFFNNTRDEDLYTEEPNLRFYSKTDSAKIIEVKSFINNLPDKGHFYEHFIQTLEPKKHGHDFERFGNSAMIDEKFFGFMDRGYCKIQGITFDGKPKRLLVSLGADKEVEDANLVLRLDKPNGQIIKNFKAKSLGSAWSHSVIALDLPIIKGKYDLFLSMNHPQIKNKWIQIDWLSFQNPISDDSTHKKYLELINAKVEKHPILQDGFGDLKRKTNVFERGNWLVHGKEVQPDVPLILGKLSNNLPKNRLGFAKWLVDKKNPLTARVMVNRIWEQIFGIGIIETVEDFGTQGFAPSNQQLLDYLAVNFQYDQKWSIKKLIKTIVMSATYQQSSVVNAELIEKDPYNRLLARGPRVRLSAESIRDQAMLVSGLYSDKMFGPSVMPFQPDGLWSSPWSGSSWVNAVGDDAHRRAIYTYWKRTTPYPSMLTFDSPSREFCQSRRIRTNTPLQALILLNDPVFIEAAKSLASKMAKNEIQLSKQIETGYQLIMIKKISLKKRLVLENLYKRCLVDFKKDKEKFSKFKITKPEDAALIMVANTILNLDEAITKE